MIDEKINYLKTLGEKYYKKLSEDIDKSIEENSIDEKIKRGWLNKEEINMSVQCFYPDEILKIKNIDYPMNFLPNNVNAVEYKKKKRVIKRYYQYLIEKIKNANVIDSNYRDNIIEASIIIHDYIYVFNAKEYIDYLSLKIETSSKYNMFLMYSEVKQIINLLGYNESIKINDISSNYKPKEIEKIKEKHFLNNLIENFALSKTNFNDENKIITRQNYTNLTSLVSVIDGLSLKKKNFDFLKINISPKVEFEVIKNTINIKQNIDSYDIVICNNFKEKNFKNNISSKVNIFISESSYEVKTDISVVRELKFVFENFFKDSGRELIFDEKSNDYLIKIKLKKKAENSVVDANEIILKIFSELINGINIKTKFTYSELWVNNNLDENLRESLLLDFKSFYKDIILNVRELDLKEITASENKKNNVKKKI